jgi:hypothetical protein
MPEPLPEGTEPLPATPKSSGLAAMDPKNYGVVSTEHALASRQQSKPPVLFKVRELLNAVHESAFPKGDISDQTRLEWENIEGEVMGEVLAHGIGAGTPFVQIHDDLFNFATVNECVDEMIGKTAAEIIRKRGDIIPSFTAMKENLNRLLISWKGMGRDEQIRMLQAFSISLQEQERNDPTKSLMRRI